MIKYANMKKFFKPTWRKVIITVLLLLVTMICLAGGSRDSWGWIPLEPRTFYDIILIPLFLIPFWISASLSKFDNALLFFGSVLLFWVLWTYFLSCIINLLINRVFIRKTT